MSFFLLPEKGFGYRDGAFSFGQLAVLDSAPETKTPGWSSTYLEFTRL